jgi:hypothetical protein
MHHAMDPNDIVRLWPHSYPVVEFDDPLAQPVVRQALQPTSESILETAAGIGNRAP